MPVVVSRRFITPAAAAAGLPLLLKAGNARAKKARREGTAPGAPSCIPLCHTDEVAAQATIEARS